MGFLHYAPPLSFYSDSARTALHESNNHDLAALHFWLTLLSPQLLPSQIVPSMLLHSVLSVSVPAQLSDRVRRIFSVPGE